MTSKWIWNKMKMKRANISEEVQEEDVEEVKEKVKEEVKEEDVEEDVEEVEVVDVESVKC